MSTRSTTRRRFAGLLAIGGVAVALGLLPRVTHADGAKPHIEIMVLHAKQDAKGGHIDPQVSKLPQLTQPPFSAYNTYILLDKKTLPLDQAKPADPWKGKPMATYSLVNGKTLEVALLDSLPGNRFQMGAAIGQGVQPDLIKYNAPANDPVFIAGQSYNGGILVVGITLRP
jgi:hypothetical protein